MIWHRLIYRPDEKRRNFLSFIFFYTTFSFGLFFTAFYNTDSVHDSVLYEVTERNLGDIPLPIWGACAMLVVVVNLVGIVVSNAAVVKAAAMGGFLVWLFASIAYMFTDEDFQFFAIALPQVVFWVWYYFKVGEFKRVYDRI